MCLFLGQNVDELVEVCDTAASKELYQLDVDVTWLNDVKQVLSLWPHDATSSYQLSEKRAVGIKTIKQVNTIEVHRSSLSLIQRSVITAVYNQHNHSLIVYHDKLSSNVHRTTNMTLVFHKPSQKKRR